ncbi:MAG: PAS domain S-box protein, partial [Thermodesulfobacteriota bacterium]
MIYLDLILNLTLLVAISVVSAFIEKRWSRRSRTGILLQGTLFGAAAVIGMLKPLDFGSGIIFDGRSVMISLCALFFGLPAVAITAVMAIICRIALGGGGMLTGVLVILSSALIGLLAHRRLKPDITLPSTGYLYLFGITVHLAMLVLLFTLPGGAGVTVVKKIGPAIMLLYPLATILSGTILADQLSALRVLAELRASETLFRTLFDEHMAVKLIIDPGTGAIVDANKAAEDYYGWSKAELKAMRIQDINTLSPEEIAREMENVLNRKRIHFEFRHRQADGSVRDVAVFSSKIVVKGRELLHSIIHDVTEQKEMQRLLQEREVKYRELFDNAPVGIFSTTAGGRPLT